MQSQPGNISVNSDRSRIDPSIKTASFFKFSGARTSRMTGVSPLSSNMGTSVRPRSPDPPVRSTFIVFSPAYPFSVEECLAGGAPEEWIPLRPPDFYGEQGIELRLGTRV